MGNHLVFVGGGHAHLTALVRLREYLRSGHRVTLISPSPYHYYSGMGPGMLSGIYRPQEVRFHVKKLAQDRGAAFIADVVVAVDPRNHILSLKSGKDVSYDVVSFNTGSGVAAEEYLATPVGNIFPVKPIINLLSARRLIMGSSREAFKTFLVAGGGAAGVEIAANLCSLLKNGHLAGKIILIAGEKLLRGYPEKARVLALRSLRGRKVEVIEGLHVHDVRKDEALLQDGTTLAYDMAFLATGIRPASLFKNSGLPVGEDGGLLVNAFLHSVSFPDIFGGGDCISFAGNPLPKVGVYAVRQNPVLFQNLMAALEKSHLKPFVPQKDFLTILNMGDGRGILWRKGWVWEGRLSFMLKDYIDRAFMKKFQVSGERDEEE
jgi:NADH dehydrogenase FAD-containing subunit